ncbi:MAG: response regulator [Acidobacteriota bacterium]
MSVAHSYESYVVSCGHCHRPYDALTAPWCRCVSDDVAVACSHCQSCVHKEGKGAATAFWFHAPDTLLRMRAGEKERRRKTEARARPPIARVLIVDDDEEIRVIAKYVLDQMGYDCLTANGPAMAMNIVETFRPAVVLTDALMPGGDGRELCKTIKLAHPEVKVVVMTSLYTAPRYASEAARLFRADDYLVKPIDFERLHSVMARLAPSTRKEER